MTYTPVAKRPRDESRERLKAYVATLPVSRRDPCMVYFFFSDETERVKIGIAADPWARLASLQTGCPEELGLLGFINAPGSAQQLEREWHARFRQDRVRGEWFALTPELMDAILLEASQDWEWLEALVGHGPIFEDDEPRLTDKPKPPAGAEVPKGRGSKLARYKLARGIVD